MMTEIASMAADARSSPTTLTRILALYMQQDKLVGSPYFARIRGDPHLGFNLLALDAVAPSPGGGAGCGR